MYEILKHAHSGIAYLVLLFVTLAFLNALIGMITKRAWGNRDFSLSLISLIVTHIMVLIGLVMYFMSPYFEALTSDAGTVMKNAGLRKLAIEHPITMIIAVVLITIGYSKHKKKNLSQAKFKTITIFYGLALAAILWAVPWSQWM